MYEMQTYEAILARMLERVPDSIDKREGSVIYDACAPAAAELAQLYIELDINYSLSFVDTASGEYLGRKTAEFGVHRAPAAAARRKGIFLGAADAPIQVPLGSRFSIEGLTYAVKERIGAGVYMLVCESAGTIGNAHFGTLIPIDYVAGLVKAELADVLVAGEEEETDSSLRSRFYEIVNEPSFGGNVAEYKQLIHAMPGVGAVKIFPVWNGGGTVKCTVISSDWEIPSSTLIDTIQSAIDPESNHGKGMGLAPIGHQVTVDGVSSITVNVETSLTLASDYTLGMIRADAETVLRDYLLELRQDWANQNSLTVRLAQMDARLLTVQGVEDVYGTKINGNAVNLTLNESDVPLLGAVTLHE
ncbi:baseplate J/gp47 family protein [Paenibacillus sp. GXUN7292]|uniref:baseplate J/gp47 family protein n=1 Tax=Paenibacillus sp. GXUN7292 TaxID=3422499 RepID=UPI003D7CB291